METIDLTAAAVDEARCQRHALEDVTRRLSSVAASLDPDAVDQASLRRAAADLEDAVHRIRWVSDIWVP